MKPFCFSVLIGCLLLVAGQPMAQNPRNVVFYDLTSTDCGHCSCLDSMMRLFILPAYPQTIPIALHSPINSAFMNYQGNELYGYFNAYFAPAGNIDGLGTYLTWHVVSDSLSSRYEKSPEALVSIQVVSKSWNPTSREVTLSAIMTNLGQEIEGVFRCQIFVTESNLKAMHRVESGCATPDDPGGLPFRHEYINEDVVRKVEFIRDTSQANPHWGNDLISPDWPSGEAVTKTWTIGIDTGWIPSNCYVNLVVYKDNQDSLYKSLHLQGLRESVTGGVGIKPVEYEVVRDDISLIYPNPASRWVNIHLSIANAGICKLDIYDIQGRQVEELMHQDLPAGLYNFELNAAELPAGSYLCRLTTATGEVIKKLVIR